MHQNADARQSTLLSIRVGVREERKTKAGRSSGMQALRGGSRSLACLAMSKSVHDSFMIENTTLVYTCIHLCALVDTCGHFWALVSTCGKILLVENLTDFPIVSPILLVSNSSL